MKKVLMLIALVFGTSVMVSAAPLANKTAVTKAVTTNKHKKHHKEKAEKKSVATESVAPKAK